MNAPAPIELDPAPRGREVLHLRSAPEAPPRASAPPRRPQAWLALLPFAIALGLALFLLFASTRMLIGAGRADVFSPTIGRGIGWCIAAVSVGVAARWTLFFVMAFLAHLRLGVAGAATPRRWPKVSILVPAYNESETIRAALQSLLELDYPRYEVIVVDDGSKDDTFALARPFEGDYGHRSIRVFTKPNGGKWSALNYAFAQCSSELVLCVDADSRLDRQALRRMVTRLSDPAISAVCGQVRVRNRHNLLTRLQAMEYIIANGLIRLAQSLTRTVLVVPGPIGLFRRSVLEQVFQRFGRETRCERPGECQGPFEGDTFAEDFDLSLTILALGGRTVYETAAISHTKAPDTSFRLLNQRYRWGRGTIQVLRKYFRRAAGDPGLIHPVLSAWIAIAYVLELAVVPVVNLAGLTAFLTLVVSGADLLPILTWLSAFALLNLNAAAFFTAIHGDDLRLVPVMLFYDLYHAFLLNAGWLIAMVDEFRGVRMRW